MINNDKRREASIFRKFCKWKYDHFDNIEKEYARNDLMHLLRGYFLSIRQESIRWLILLCSLAEDWAIALFLYEFLTDRKKSLLLDEPNRI